MKNNTLNFPNLRFEKKMIELDFNGNKIFKSVNYTGKHGRSPYVYTVKNEGNFMMFYSLKDVNKYNHNLIQKFLGENENVKRDGKN